MDYEFIVNVSKGGGRQELAKLLKRFLITKTGLRIHQGRYLINIQRIPTPKKKDI